MVYTNKRTKGLVLNAGVYKGYSFKVVSYGTHPCCYVNIGKAEQYNSMSVTHIASSLGVHGGITYVERKVPITGRTTSNLWLGWDYMSTSDYMDKKHWTTEELMDAVKKCINDLIKIKENMKSL